MPLILSIDLVVVGVLIFIALTKGVEKALPFFAFVVTLVPGESQIALPGLFQLTTQRVATVALLVLYLAFGKNSANEGQKQASPLKYLILLILGWNLISTLNSIVFTHSLKEVLSSVLDFYLVYYIFTKTVTSTETVHKILRAFVAALVVCCVFGWFEAYYHWRVINLFPAVTYRFSNQGYDVDLSRIQSTFPHSILFGNALALGIPWALYLLTLAKTAAQKTYLWVAVVLMFWNIYKTMSRGPWLGLILEAALMFLFSQVKIRKYLVVVFVLSVAVCVIRPGVWTTLKDTYLETNDPDSPRGSSYQYRYDLMHEGRKALEKDLGRAAWGFGPGSFYYLGLEGTDPTTGHTEKFESCDSAFVDIMVGTGYVGLLLVVALLLEPTLVSLRAFGSLPRPANQLSLVFLVNLVAFAFMMVSVMNWGWGQQTYMVWIIFGLSMTYPRLATRETIGGGEPGRGERETASWLPEVRPSLPEVPVW